MGVGYQSRLQVPGLTGYQDMVLETYMPRKDVTATRRLDMHGTGSKSWASSISPRKARVAL